jgi:hypothetical protein
MQLGEETATDDLQGHVRIHVRTSIRSGEVAGSIGDRWMVYLIFISNFKLVIEFISNIPENFFFR